MKKKIMVLIASIMILGVSATADASYDPDRDIYMEAVEDEYIVVLKPNVSAQEHDVVYAQVLRRYSSLNAMLVRTTNPESLKTENVKYVEPNYTVQIMGEQSNATWGIDRIDSRRGLDKAYNYSATGNGVNVYIVDTGLMASHKEFQGRVGEGFSVIGDDTEDCNGHGTHVAGTVLGTTYGVAKQAKIYPVRVLNCNGSGSMSGIIEGIEWLVANAKKPAVANMSLGGNKSQALNDAVARASKAGILFVVAAGNSSDSACRYSPASAPEAITVASMGKTDISSEFTSYGSCVDIYAPGEQILSAGIQDSTDTDTMGGTSMASPHVAGAVALLLQLDSNATPETIASRLVGAASRGILSKVPSGTPNLMLFTDPGEQPPTPDEPPSSDIPSECQQPDGCYEESGSLTARNYHVQIPDDSYMTVRSQMQLKIYAEGSEDLDLYLYFYENSRWNLVAGANETGKTESMEYSAQPGYYAWILMLKTAGFAGSYHVWIVK